jgi:hypothetical protein
MATEVIFDILPGDWKNQKTPNGGALKRLALHGFTKDPGK